MKKILIALIVWGAITFINIDLFASSYHGITLDTQLQELGSYSLRDVFDTNNLIQNHDFSNGLNNWDLYGFTSSFNNNILTLTGDGTLAYPYIRQQNVFNSTDTYYVNVNVKTNKQVQAIKIEASTNDNIIYNPSDEVWYDLSYIRQPVSYTSLVVQLLDSTVYTSNYYLDIEMGIYVINLSYFNLQLDINQLNYYFEVYKVLSFYENGYNVGYNDGYTDGINEGYLNGQADYYNGIYNPNFPKLSSQPYLDGYNDGYSLGQEEGYDIGYLDGNVAGLETGYNNGYNDGYSNGVLEEVDTQYLLGFVSSTVDILGVSIIPGISLGVFVFIPLFLGFIGFIFRLGGRRG